jgi:hypothetical protein
MEQEKHTARIGEMRNMLFVLVGIAVRKTDLGSDERITLKWLLKK